VLLAIKHFGDDDRARRRPGEASLATTHSAPGAGEGQPGVRTLANQRALKLG